MTKEELQIYQKNYREKHKDRILSYEKNYRTINLEKIRENNRKYNKDNKEQRRLRNKRYRDKHAEELKSKAKIKRQRYKKEINFHRNERLQKDPIFRLNYKIRSIISKSFKIINHRKNSKTVSILGCSVSFFKSYIQSKWEPWMNWENRGLYNGTKNHGWDIDHIIPISTAKTKEDIIKLNHYSNLQPLCSYVNRNIKKDRYG